MAVEQGKQKRQNAAVLMFAGEKHPFPGNKAVVEDHVGIGRTRHKSAFVMFSFPQIMNRHHLLQTVPVTRNGESHGVVFVFRAQGTGGNHQNFIGHGGFGNMNLTAFNNDTVLGPLLNVNIRAGIGLFGRTQHAVALYIRLRTATNEVFRLETGQPFLEIFMILGGAFVDLVRFIGNIINGVGAVNAHAALDAAANFLAEHAGHVLFLVQIFLVLVNVGKTVDLLVR